MLGFFKRFQCESAGNRRKAFQEVFDGFTALKILEERLNRYSCPSKHWDAMHRLRILCDRLRHLFIVSQAGSV